MEKELLDNKKDLLLKDLCARLPYGVIVNVKGFDFDFKDKLTQIYNRGYGCSIQVTNNMPYGIEQVKPYLFPLSSMTEEQKSELSRFCNCTIYVTNWNFRFPDYVQNTMNNWEKAFTWLNKHHFDYRGLIEWGLAIDATGLNIY